MLTAGHFSGSHSLLAGDSWYRLTVMGLKPCADSPIGCLRQAEGAEGKAEIKEARGRQNHGRDFEIG